MFIKYKTLNMQKKPAKEKVQDWHSADIVAAIRKTGTSLQRISREHGLCNAAVGQALHRPYPKSERIIAERLGIEPQVIWPSRYNLDGTPKSGRGERGIGRFPAQLTSALKTKVNDTTIIDSRNVNALDKVAA